MDALSAFLLVVATCAVCFFLFQLYTVYENYGNIVEFNDEYRSLEYAKTIGGSYVDRTVYDPNDSVLDPTEKWRCVIRNGKYISVSKFGFKYDSVLGKTLEFPTMEDCINFNYGSIFSGDIYNPCTDPTSEECLFLKSVL
ncbi:IMV membrane protein [Saltwater crocodilepox virus]|nr:IMV membrane protein [Saltwater crocodilepox virus]QGT49410.1 ORF186 [Saltwater crocodilepox virus]